MNPPEWWRRSHPEEMMAFESGKLGANAAVASKTYRRDAGEALKLTIAFCEKHFAGHMAGYHPSGGNTGEWFYQETWGPELSGYDPATLAAWRQWLTARYKDDASLRAAWSDPVVSLAEVAVPAPWLRRGLADQGLFEPAAARVVVDFNRFLQEAMADCVLSLARDIREAAGPDRLSVFFYGYVFEFAGVRNGPATAGHYALRRLLASPDIDVLCSPISYLDRGLGGGGPSMTTAESVALAGKLWLNEDDTSTYIAHATGNDFPGWNHGAETLKQSIELLRRGLIVTGCRNFATWWMDLGGTGWFADPQLWTQMDLFKNLNQERQDHPLAFKPEVAVLADERALQLVTGSGLARAASGSLMYSGREDLNRIGAPYGQYLLDDFLVGKVGAKLRAFLAAYALTGAERHQLRAATATGASIWAWTPGYVDLDTGRFSLAAVEELTGFPVRLAPAGTKARVRATEAGLKLGLPEEFGPDAELAPMLIPQPAGDDQVLATYASGEPAVVLRRAAESAQLFCATTSIPSTLYRLMAKLGGVHLYAEQDVNIYALGSYIGLHGAADGRLDLDFGQVGNIWNEFEQKDLGRKQKLSLDLRQGQTYLFRLTPAKP